jgi:hypothetical protein
MIITAVPTRAGLALLLLLALAPARGGGNLYRYTDDSGSVVVGYQIPPEDVARGYEILDNKGVVIQVVPPALTGEAIEAAEAAKRREAQAREEEKRLRRWDESLLRRYSTVADIEGARERALGELRIRLNILKSNKRSLGQRVENYQLQAADLERRGRTVEPEQLQAIKALQAEIKSTDRSIRDRQQEIEEVAAAYQKDIDRFEQLLDVVELRRSLAVRERERSEERESGSPGGSRR